MSSFIDEYFDAYFEWSPTSATAAGLHQYDAKIENLSAAAFNNRIERLKDLLIRSGGDSIDAEIIRSQINAELLDLETLKTWRTNPLWYAGLPGGAIDGLIKRDFAPPSHRLRSVIERLKGIPAILDAMRENVENPPREFTDLAVRVVSGSVGFFKDTISAWAVEASRGDSTLENDFNRANALVIRSLEDAALWLEKSLLPRSRGEYAIGAENFSRKLLYEEMVDDPVDRLLVIGEANLEKDRKAFIETARKIHPSKSPAEVMEWVSRVHPSESHLIKEARDTVEGVIQFLIDKRIVTIPSDVRPTITETPPYARSGAFAMMDTPGPYEALATEAFYYVTPPEKEWDDKHKEEHLRLFNRPVMEIITVHEAYPGHYIQFLNAKHFPTKTRKLISCGSNAEGWAHYAEQMMIEEGYGNGDLRIHLAQLHEALLRDARWVVGIKLHTEGWTVEQGAKYFEEQAFQEPANAYEEARRGAYNPTYLYYTLGKLQIYKLREDYRKAKAASYNLREFHDEFVKQGSIPIKLVRRIMLDGDNGPTL